MNARHDMQIATRRRVMLHDVQLCLTLALILSGAIGLNSFRARAEARAASYHAGAVIARAEYAKHSGIVRAYRQQREGVRPDSAVSPRPADSISRTAAFLLRLEEEDAARAAARIPVLVASAHAASTESGWFAAGMVAVLALGVLPAWHWRRVQRRGPPDAPAGGTHG